MNLKEVLKMADELVFAKTGQHLDDLQEAVLRGTIQGEKYTQIAEEIHCNESYVRDIGAKLWQVLSEELGEEVNKSNLRSTMGRFIFGFDVWYWMVNCRNVASNNGIFQLFNRTSSANLLIWTNWFRYRLNAGVQF